MNNIILCEGSTDYVLLQYYMRKAYHWLDDKSIQNGILKMPNQHSRNIMKNSDILTIMAVGGCSQFGDALKLVLNRNKFSPPSLSDVYSKIVIVTDRDEVGTEESFVESLKNVLDEYHVKSTMDLSNNTWLQCSMCNQVGLEVNFEILLLVIPFEETGAMETFLLDAISENDPYDKSIITECNQLVDRVDPEKRYLTSRRYITKAKFDTYFSIRTPYEQFAQRGNILKNVSWEQYNSIQSAFQKLGDL